jgi:hypothetical protein
VYVGNLVGEQGDKGRNAAQLPRFRLHRVVHVAEVLQVRRCVGLQQYKIQRLKGLCNIISFFEGLKNQISTSCIN